MLLVVPAVAVVMVSLLVNAICTSTLEQIGEKRLTELTRLDAGRAALGIVVGTNWDECGPAIETKTLKMDGQGARAGKSRIGSSRMSRLRMRMLWTPTCMGQRDSLFWTTRFAQAAPDAQDRIEAKPGGIPILISA